MENVIKRLLQIFPVVVIIVCSYFAAQSSNNVLRVFLQEKFGNTELTKSNSKYSTNTYKPKRKRNSQANLTLNLITGEPIIQNPIEPEVFEEKEEPQPVLDVSAESDLVAAANQIDCGFGLFGGTPCEAAPDKYGYLIGTIVSTNPLESSARVLMKNNVSRSFEVGDIISPSASSSSAASNGEGSSTQGAKVVKICRRKVYLMEQGKLLCLTSQADSKKLSEMARSRASTEAPPEGEGVKKVSDTEFRVSRDELEHALNNLDKLATQARVVPHFKGGKSVGFRIYAIKPGSLYDKIGLRNGDIIHRVNGMEINSPEKALEIYTKLKDAEHISIDITRRGKPMTLEYFIQ